MASKIDGSFTAPLLVENIPFRPIEGTDDTGFKETYVQLVANYTRQALDTQSTVNAGHYLVEESDPERIGAGLYRFTRMVVAIPTTRFETESVSFNYPGLSDIAPPAWGSYWKRLPVTLTVRATIERQYYLTRSPQNISTPEVTVSRKGVVLGPNPESGEVVDWIGPYLTLSGTQFTTPATEPNQYIIEKPTPTRWMGNIWEVVIRRVPKLADAIVVG